MTAQEAFLRLIDERVVEIYESKLESTIEKRIQAITSPSRMITKREASKLFNLGEKLIDKIVDQYKVPYFLQSMRGGNSAKTFKYRDFDLALNRYVKSKSF